MSSEFRTKASTKIGLGAVTGKLLRQVLCSLDEAKMEVTLKIGRWKVRTGWAMPLTRACTSGEVCKKLEAHRAVNANVKRVSACGR
jgi:hypothetical protein